MVGEMIISLRLLLICHQICRSRCAFFLGGFRTHWHQESSDLRVRRSVPPRVGSTPVPSRPVFPACEYSNRFPRGQELLPTRDMREHQYSQLSELTRPTISSLIVGPFRAQGPTCMMCTQGRSVKL